MGISPLQHATTGSALFGIGLTHPICSPAGIATDRSAPLVEARLMAILPIIESVVTNMAEEVKCTPSDAAKRIASGSRLALEMIKNPERARQEIKSGSLAKRSYFVGEILESLENLDINPIAKIANEPELREIFICLLPQIITGISRICIFRRAHARTDISLQLDGFVTRLLKITNQTYSTARECERESITKTAIDVLRRSSWEDSNPSTEIALKILDGKIDSTVLLCQELKNQHTLSQRLLTRVKKGPLHRTTQLFSRILSSLSRNDFYKIILFFGRFEDSESFCPTALDRVIVELKQRGLNDLSFKKLADAYQYTESICADQKVIPTTQSKLAAALEITEIIERAKAGLHKEALTLHNRLSDQTSKYGIYLTYTPLEVILEFILRSRYNHFYKGIKTILKKPQGMGALEYALKIVPEKELYKYEKTISYFS